MMRNLSARNLFLAAALAVMSAQPAAAALSTTQSYYYALLAGFHAAAGRHAQAAASYAALGEELEEPALWRLATQEAVRARQLPLAVRYAARWRLQSNDARAVESLASLLVLSGRQGEVAPLLGELRQRERLTARELFNLLGQAADKKAALAQMENFTSPEAEGGAYYLARMAMVAGDDNAARNYLREARRRGDHDVEAVFSEALLAEEGGGDIRRLNAWREDGCPGAENGCFEENVVHAYSLFRTNRIDWRAPLDEPQPRAEAAAYGAGIFYEAEKDEAAATRMYESLTPHSEWYASARLGLYRLARDGGHKQRAAEVLMEGLREARAAGHFTSDEIVRMEISLAHAMQKWRGGENGYDHIRAAMEEFPRNGRLLYHLAIFAEEGGRIDEAVNTLARLAELEPDDPEHWNALGYVMADHSIDLPRAKRYIERALLADGDNPNILDSMGWVLYRMGDLEAARGFLWEAARRSDAAEIGAHLGEVLHEMGRDEEARAVWRRALEKHPDNRVLLETLRRFGFDG